MKGHVLIKRCRCSLIPDCIPMWTLNVRCRCSVTQIGTNSSWVPVYEHPLKVECCNPTQHCLIILESHCGACTTTTNYCKEWSQCCRRAVIFNTVWVEVTSIFYQQNKVKLPAVWFLGVVMVRIIHCVVLNHTGYTAELKYIFECMYFLVALEV